MTTGCHCVKSRCLKLYCECFANGRFCVGCSCQDCNNTQQHSDLVASKRCAIKEKNAEAFQGTSKGCNCKRSQCLKMYCECFKHGVRCQVGCKCTDCLNLTDGLRHRARRTSQADSQSIASLEPEPKDRIELVLWNNQSKTQLSQHSSRVGGAIISSDEPAYVRQSYALRNTDPVAASSVPAEQSNAVACLSRRPSQDWLPNCKASTSRNSESDSAGLSPKRQAAGGRNSQWGISKPRTTTARQASNASKLKTEPSYSDAGYPPPRRGHGSAQLRPLSPKLHSNLHHQAVPGDHTFLFGTMGQPLMREVTFNEEHAYLWKAAGAHASQAEPKWQPAAELNHTTAQASLLSGSRHGHAHGRCAAPSLPAGDKTSFKQSLENYMESQPQAEAWPGTEQCVDGNENMHKQHTMRNVLFHTTPPTSPCHTQPTADVMMLSPSTASPSQKQASKMAALHMDATPNAHHLIYAARGHNGGEEEGEERPRILSAEELMPMAAEEKPVRSSKVFDTPNKIFVMATPDKVGGLGTSPCFQSHDLSPEDHRSTVPQLFTPEMSNVLDLDIPIRWRGLDDHISSAAMSPLPTVTPLVLTAERATFTLQGLRQCPGMPAAASPAAAEASRLLRSHRTLDFSNTSGRANLAQLGALNLEWPEAPSPMLVDSPAPSDKSSPGYCPPDLRMQALQYIQSQVAAFQ